MKQWKRLIYYLVINILVSACTTLGVLYFWDRTHPSDFGGLGPVAVHSGAQALSATQAVTGAAGTPEGAAPSTPTSSPTPDPYENAIAYEVKANDTMGEIAQKFDVPLEELLDYNGLEDANALSVGQVVYIPVEQPAEPTQTPAAAETSAPRTTGTPSGPVVEARVEISSVIGPGDLSSERVFLTRSGDGALSLTGWKLSDEDENVFTFPQLELYEDGGLNVWTSAGSATVVDLYWGLPAAVWESGEIVTLSDAQGRAHATYEVP